MKKNTELQITVAPVAITISPSSLPNGTVGSAYSRTLGATGGVGPYKFKKASGALPPEVKLKPKGVLQRHAEEGRHLLVRGPGDGQVQVHGDPQLHREVTAMSRRTRNGRGDRATATRRRRGRS